MLYRNCGASELFTVTRHVKFNLIIQKQLAIYVGHIKQV